MVVLGGGAVSYVVLIPMSTSYWHSGACPSLYLSLSLSVSLSLSLPLSFSLSLSLSLSRSLYPSPTLSPFVSLSRSLSLNTLARFRSADTLHSGSNIQDLGFRAYAAFPDELDT